MQQLSLIKEAIEVAVRFVELCEVRKISPRTGCKMINNILFSEYLSVIGQKITELQDRVCRLMVVIVDIVTKYVRHLTFMVYLTFMV